MATQIAASVPSKRLAASILSTDLAFTLNNILKWNGVALTSADFGTRAFGVFRNSTNDQIEFFEWDPTTVASASITIISRALDYKGGTTANIATAYNWPANETICELGSHTPQLFEQYMDKTSDETVIGIKTFSSSPVVPTGGTGTQAANATDIANAVTGASGTATNLVNGTLKLSVAAASAPAPIAVGDNDPRVPTTNQIAAMAGQSGTAPSVSNKFEDNSDTSATSSAGKLVRANGSGKIDSGFLSATEDYQVFTGSGTWNKPSTFSANALVFVQAWGGGGSGGGVNRSGTDSFGSGGGGGAYAEAYFRLSDLGSTVTVTVGAGGTGGTSDGIQGGNTTFGTLLTAYGGGSGTGSSGGSNTNGAGGAGIFAQGPAAAAAGASPLGGTQGTPGGTSTFGGGGGGQNAASSAGGHSVYGGGGGSSGYSSGQTGVGGNSLYGGAGGAGASNTVGTTSGGTGIVYGGNGGTGAGSTTSANGGNGSAPSGGGGGASRVTSNGTQTGGNGGRGEVRVWTIAGI